ncbi:MAG: DNA polymerase III subunit delta [Candidatus Doudnabacteria bacterium]|nr:DNA polymerase III subunit delta [Candidatus Doudnabacteria bacterium]
MLTLLVGPDEYSREAYIRQKVSQAGVGRVDLDADATHVTLDDLLGQDLFSPSQVLVVEQGAEQFLVENTIPLLVASANHILFVEPQLDQRTKFAKAVMQDDRITKVLCNPPDLAGLPAWVEQYVQTRSGAIAPQATQRLLGRLGYIDPLGGQAAALREPSLGVLAQELNKLLTYAGGEQISPAMVEQLVPDDRTVVTFAITDALARKDKKNLVSLLDAYYGAATEDETSQTIALAALLAEQLRAALIVISAAAERIPEQQLLAETGWKPGRLFMVKKQATQFTAAKLKDALAKLESLDVELKSSTMPPRVMMELIMVQMV